MRRRRRRLQPRPAVPSPAFVWGDCQAKTSEIGNWNASKSITSRICCVTSLPLGKIRTGGEDRVIRRPNSDGLICERCDTANASYLLLNAFECLRVAKSPIDIGNLKSVSISNIQCICIADFKSVAWIDRITRRGMQNAGDDAGGINGRLGHGGCAGGLDGSESPGFRWWAGQGRLAKPGEQIGKNLWKKWKELKLMRNFFINEENLKIRFNNCLSFVKVPVKTRVLHEYTF